MTALEHRGGFLDVSDRPLGVETGVEGPASSMGTERRALSRSEKLVLLAELEQLGSGLGNDPDPLQPSRAKPPLKRQRLD